MPDSSPLHPLAFAGTASDARDVLTAISATMVTVIALVLGLTIVALQVASTQFSPRLLRNFLRDRPNQVVLAVFVATFAYSTAGLYTVGTAEAADQDFPGSRSPARSCWSSSASACSSTSCTTWLTRSGSTP